MILLFWLLFPHWILEVRCMAKPANCARTVACQSVAQRDWAVSTSMSDCYSKASWTAQRAAARKVTSELSFDFSKHPMGNWLRENPNIGRAFLVLHAGPFCSIQRSRAGPPDMLLLCVASRWLPLKCRFFVCDRWFAHFLRPLQKPLGTCPTTSRKSRSPLYCYSYGFTIYE